MRGQSWGRVEGHDLGEQAPEWVPNGEHMMLIVRHRGHLVVTRPEERTTAVIPYNAQAKPDTEVPVVAANVVLIEYSDTSFLEVLEQREVPR